MKCLRCNRELTKPGQTIGDICKRKALKESDSIEKKIRVEPIYTAWNNRRYLVFTSPRRFVQIYVAADGSKTADCECQPNDVCEHIAAAAERDAIRFPQNAALAV